MWLPSLRRRANTWGSALPWPSWICVSCLKKWVKLWVNWEGGVVTCLQLPESPLDLSHKTRHWKGGLWTGEEGLPRKIAGSHDPSTWHWRHPTTVVQCRDFSPPIVQRNHKVEEAAVAEGSLAINRGGLLLLASTSAAWKTGFWSEDKFHLSTDYCFIFQLCSLVLMAGEYQ